MSRNKEQHIEGFYVTFHGDNSVGIFDHEWKITGGFQFNDDESLNSFKEHIIHAFEYCSDTPINVETFEERADLLKKENEAYRNSLG